MFPPACTPLLAAHRRRRGRAPTRRKEGSGNKPWPGAQCGDPCELERREAADSEPRPLPWAPPPASAATSPWALRPQRQQGNLSPKDEEGDRKGTGRDRGGGGLTAPGLKPAPHGASPGSAHAPAAPLPQGPCRAAHPCSEPARPPGEGGEGTHSACPRQKDSMLCGAAAQLTRIFSSRSAVRT